MGLHIIITGNPVDGFQYFGPFKTAADAAAWGNNDAHLDWWLAPLEAAETLCERPAA